MLKKVLLLVVFSVALFIVSCSTKNNVEKAVEGSGVENSVSKAVSSGTATSKNGDIVTLSRAVLEDNNLKLTFVNYDSKLNSFIITKGNGSTTTVNSSNLTITSADLFQGSEVKVKLNGPATFKLKMDLNSNLTCSYDLNECTGGVAIIKNGLTKLPWNARKDGDYNKESLGAKAWYDNAKNLGFIVGNTPKVGAIIVFDGASWNGNYGHVAVVTKVSPLTINEKNTPYGTGNWRLNWEVSNTYKNSIKGYIYYKLDKVNPWYNIIKK